MGYPNSIVVLTLNPFNSYLAILTNFVFDNISQFILYFGWNRVDLSAADPRRGTVR
jgi:hypothetical protein